MLGLEFTEKINIFMTLTDLQAVVGEFSILYSNTVVSVEDNSTAALKRSRFVRAPIGMTGLAADCISSEWWRG
ncbi:MAG: hypothetical protein AB4040_01910 [Synechococcus sp.]